MGVVSRRWVSVESMGVASGWGCKEAYRFRHIISLLLLYLLFFAAASLLFVIFLNVFRSLDYRLKGLSVCVKL